MSFKRCIKLKPQLSVSFHSALQSAVVALCQSTVVSVTAKLLLSRLCCRIFLSLMEDAGLTDLLKQEGGFTLFAPSDKAFAALSDSDLRLLKSRFLCYTQSE